MRLADAAALPAINRTSPTALAMISIRHGATQWVEKRFMFDQSLTAEPSEMGMDDPLGKAFSVWGFKGPLVGVVKDYNFQSMHSEIKPIFYILDPVFWNEVVVRLASGQDTSKDDIQTVWKQFGDDYPLEINFVDEQVRGLYEREQGLTKVLTLFSLLTVLIIIIGLITLSVFSFNRRQKEIGIRKVNGAT